jgi:hypothetical protein
MPMNTEPADALHFIDGPDSPVDAWSLDELDRDADLESLHWAMERTDDFTY